MIDAPAHAAILRKVAAAAVTDARTAWKRAHRRPTVARVRLAFRACVFAARALRKAAPVSPDDADRMLAEAVVIDDTAEKLKRQLVLMLEDSSSFLPRLR